MAGEQEANPKNSPAVMRRFALFVDGMARAMILPFGPDLVHRLVNGSSEIQAQTWSRTAYFLSWVVIVYIIGRWLGVWGSRYFTTTSVPRWGGIAIALHTFTYGAGLNSVRWLAAIRFVSAFLAGLLCGITSSILLPEDEPFLQREVDIASGTAKIYLTGFAVSILSGGLLFRQATKDETFQALTGAYQYSWSPLFLVGVAVIAELTLRGLFSLASSSPDTFARDTTKDQKSIRRSSSVLFQTIADVGDEEIALLQEEQTRSGADSLAQANRSRFESFTSVEDFYDCRSHFSDMSQALSPIPTDNEQLDEHEIATYLHGKCVYSDGSASFVPPGCCAAKIPQNYMDFCKQNEAKAKKAWQKTIAWRREKRVWKIHCLPNPWFLQIKEAYPHFVHGHSRSGYPVVYENPGRMNLKELFRSGCSIDDMIHHLTFFLEYLANRLCVNEEIQGMNPSPGSTPWGMFVVMDLKGAGLSHLSGDVVKYLSKAGDLNSEHYPLAMKKAFLINSPFWLAGAWSGLKGILPETVQVDILSESKYPETLRTYIDEDQIPVEYGGTSSFALGKHPYEIALKHLVDSAENNVDEDAVSSSKNLFPDPESSNFDDRTTKVNNRIPGSFKTPQLRQRLSSIDSQKTPPRTVEFSTPRVELSASQLHVLLFVSAMHFFWSFVQGAIEIAIPLWILSPTIMGGLGYSPSRSGVALFSACLVLLATLRTRSSKLVSKIPSKSPLRAFRIGAGAESAILALLAYVSTTSP